MNNLHQRHAGILINKGTDRLGRGVMVTRNFVISQLILTPRAKPR